MAVAAGEAAEVFFGEEVFRRKACFVRQPVSCLFQEKKVGSLDNITGNRRFSREAPS